MTRDIPIYLQGVLSFRHAASLVHRTKPFVDYEANLHYTSHFHPYDFASCITAREENDDTEKFSRMYKYGFSLVLAYDFSGHFVSLFQGNRAKFTDSMKRCITHLSNTSLWKIITILSEYDASGEAHILERYRDISKKTKRFRARVENRHEKGKSFGNVYV